MSWQLAIDVLERELGRATAGRVRAILVQALPGATVVLPGQPRPVVKLTDRTVDQALADAGGNIDRAADLLGVPALRLRKWLDAYRLKPRRHPLEAYAARMAQNRPRSL